MAKRSWFERLEATQTYQRLRYSMNRELVGFFKNSLLNGRKSLRVAEVACGSGYASHLLAQEISVALSIASDISLEDHRQAKIDSYKAVFVLMDMFRPSMIPGSMDLVWNSSSIEEVEKPEEAVAAMAWLAKPGGSVFVGVPYKYGPAGWLRWFSGSSARTWLGRVYSRAELRRLMESAGLKIEVEMRYFGSVFIGALGRKPAG
ncbi:MAG: methyltransferase domain-containing protein [Chloroflexi bacterium]|nr:methyltransferase domain-containing protein [Chloroflexota bacterium]